MKRHWAKWMPKPSPTGMWLVAVFTADEPQGLVDVMFRLDDGTTVPGRADGSHAIKVKNGLWACPTDEHMTVRSVPPCSKCGQPSRMPMSSGGARHSGCSPKVKNARPEAVSSRFGEEETLF